MKVQENSHSIHVGDIAVPSRVLVCDQSDAQNSKHLGNVYSPRVILRQMKISFVPRLVIRSFSLLSSGNVITHPDGAIKLKMTSPQCLMLLATGYFSANERSLKTEKEAAISPMQKLLK